MRLQALLVGPLGALQQQHICRRSGSNEDLLIQLLRGGPNRRPVEAAAAHLVLECSDDLVLVPIRDVDVPLVTQVEVLGGLTVPSRPGRVAHPTIRQQPIQNLYRQLISPTNDP